MSIDINGLTIGQAREIAAVLGNSSDQTSGSVLDFAVGKHCVIRSNLSGVWLGYVDSTDGRGVVLRNARRAYSWEGAATCSGLALTGPTGGKITAPVDVAITDVIEAIPASNEALAAWAIVNPWTAR